MDQKFLRTYQRRNVTRTSGYHTCEDTTGGECIIKNSQLFPYTEKNISFYFFRNSIDLIELFEKGISIIAFGGYIYSKRKINIELEMSFSYEGSHFTTQRTQVVEANTWSNIGLHYEQLINLQNSIFNVSTLICS